MEERQLVRKVLEGDPVAQREFYDAHVDRVYRLAFRMTGDDEQARECTQETFIRAFDRLDGFRGDASLSTWMHSVAVSVTLGWLRKVKRFREREADMVEGDGAMANGPSPDALIDTAISAAIDRLSEIYRTVVIMHDIEGFTHDEIGKVLGIASGTSKVRLSRARTELRSLLSDFAEEFA